jgi:hypothetical protein
MAQTISNHETQLLDYLTNQIGNTLGFIKREEKSLEILTEGDLTFTEAVDEVIQSKLNDISVYKFRLIWLQSQMKKIKSVNN